MIELRKFDQSLSDATGLLFLDFHNLGLQKEIAMKVFDPFLNVLFSYSS
jgi:hypothetical protein